MLAFLKKKNLHEQTAKAVYGQLLEKTRAEVFYNDYGVPDSFDGRFDMLVLHVFLVIDRLKDEGAQGRDFNQALFDATFADMEQTLRERGIGDMGIPKHMRRMMKAFNGRIHVYSAASGNGKLMTEALMRNLYGTAIGTSQEQIESMNQYVNRCAASLWKHSVTDVVSAKAVF